MTGDADERAQDHRIKAPSLVTIAADTIRKRILAGELRPGTRLGEEQLADELDISRPPLREALRLLENEGLIDRAPRRGAYVRTLTDRDVEEILPIRSALERVAFETGIPLRDPSRLDAAREALAEMERCAREKDRGALVQAGYAFHSALIRIAGNARLEAIYASVQQQIILCMSLNLIARERFHESLETHVARHARLLDVVASGDRAAALAELAAHGERSFVQSHDEDRRSAAS
ncbi:GntR family transcriptional regulator [Microbacterium stercoris]|uniref:GntR family transcriptional regulator n=1 Tax=Microbacterium stercoris TaxID=2820289 RepID=A0A939QI87_9MICO|nr:GntR family transcriptional regulator [Microbacterium stercoris]MBO3662555.1 GntR family transcriptional regulator [Microbacterium stercoris]